MSRYKHFDDELTTADVNEAAVLPELDVDEPHQLEFKPQLRNYFSSANVSTLPNRIRLNFCSKFFSKRTRLERYLLLLSFLLGSILFLFLVFPSKNFQRKINDDLCLTNSCVQTAASIFASINRTVDPCDDFHEFVCGRWIKSNVIPKGHSTWSTTKELSRKNLIILKNILEQTNVNENSMMFNAEFEAIKFYRSCMNVSELDRLDTKPMEEFLLETLNLTIQKWIQIDRNQTWQELFVNLTQILSTKYGFSYLLPISIGPDDKNSSWNAIHIGQPQLGLNSRDYYINSSLNNRSDPETDLRNKIILDTYSQAGVELLKLLGFDKDEAQKRIDDIIQFEVELATVSLPMETLQKPNETYFLMTLKQLDEQYRNLSFDIYSYLNEMLNLNASFPLELTENDQVIVLSFELMSQVSTILHDYLLTPGKSHVVIDHFLFSFIFDLSSHLSTKFEKITLPLFKELYGLEALPDRWEVCVKETDGAFGYGLGALYIKSVFGENDRQKANELIRNIRQMFDENLNDLKWIDEPSRIEAKKKLKRITEKVGFPDFINNRTKLNERYIGYSMDANDYFYNGIKVLQRERRRSLLRFRQPVDLTDWSMTPRTVNAYYTPSANEIVFPAGILQPPFFQKDLPLSMNYGAIGTVIGHEITHGFDDQGREYDADGNIRSWWTKIALDQFEDRTKCFVKQYSNFAFDGQNENGQRTLSENIADNGGLKLSYRAYEQHKAKSIGLNENLRLPGLPYSQDQLFFISFAYSWCNLETRNAMYYDLIRVHSSLTSSIDRTFQWNETISVISSLHQTDDVILERSLNDPHSPPRFRILGTMSNSVEFAQAFSCSSNAKMNPKIKCQLW